MLVVRRGVAAAPAPVVLRGSLENLLCSFYVELRPPLVFREVFIQVR